MQSPISKKAAWKLVILLGIVSLFADMTYEGAKSITGPFLAILGASGAVVGFVAGFGELIGYAFRYVSGHISDKTGRYWLITIIGYVINLLAVPLLAFAGNWPLAASLIMLERFGKAIRAPAKDALLSYATHEVGRGFGFAVHEALDQIGAILGPALVSLLLYVYGSYQISFAVLLIPAVLALIVLLCARVLYPRPQDLEVEHPDFHGKGFSKQYWFYIAAVSCVGAGYIDFPLIAFHFEKKQLMPDAWIPLFFSIAMAADGIAALIFGKMYDVKGIGVLIVATAISSFFVPFVFFDGFYIALLGVILWGIGLGAQESIMRAFVAELVPMNKRGTGYGLMNLWFGISWFFGSLLTGYLYDLSIPSLVIFSFGIQLAAIPLLVIVKRIKT